MILVDMGGIVFSQVTASELINLNKDMLRHLIINGILSINKKFRDEYGEIVLCCEGGSWRKDVFPQYKAHRRIAREQQAETAPAESKKWSEIWSWISELIQEWTEHLPWKIIKIQKAEADDIIGTLTHLFKLNLEFGNSEKVLIVSRDKDFFQLHGPEVKQWDPVLKTFLKCENVQEFLLDHIIRGDSGDGIPNILSEDNTFIEGKRQIVMSAKRFAECKSQIKNGLYSPFYKRNEQLIDLQQIPVEIREKIIQKYNEQIEKNTTTLMNYLIENRCKNLLERLDQF